MLKPQKTNAQQGGYAPARAVKEGMVPIVFQSAEPAEMTREEKMKAYARAQDKGIKGFAEADPADPAGRRRAERRRATPPTPTRGSSNTATGRSRWTARRTGRRCRRRSRRR